ncbi:MAG: cyclophilin-like fold protein [Armatimonadota bacterium]
MARQIKITAGEVSGTAELNDSGMADLIWEACPIKSVARTWGDEIYFDIDLDTEGEDLQPTVDMGDLAYWPPGPAFCIFFGPTPMSSGEEIRPASPVSIFGQVNGDPLVYKVVRGGTPITIEQA